MAKSANTEKVPLVISQMKKRLHEIFDAHIDLSDLKSKDAVAKEPYFLTRAYMAICLMEQCGLSPADAAACITDGGNDGGIDAIYVDAQSARIFLGQSKWISDMEKGIALSDMTRFRDGVKNIIHFVWSDDNKNLQIHKNKLEKQLENIDTTLVMIVAHTSKQPLAANVEDIVKRFVSEQNAFNPGFLEFKQFTIQQAAVIARSYTRPENINVPVMLGDWGQLNQPYKAVYGSVAAEDVVGWHVAYGNKLFAENLRFGIEKSDVNEGISNTALAEGQNFWYYNNGITAICDNVIKQPIGGTDTKSGVFDVKKISIINGAQTISSLSNAKGMGADLSKVRIHFRIISLSGTPDEFASRVTTTNNTQNSLNPVDFVAADPQQERIRKEAVALGIQYAFRRGDPDPDIKHGFTIRSATIAAACAAGDLRLAVSAKRYISGLWENTKKEPYTLLFNEKTTAASLWNLVRLMNFVDEQAEKLSANLAGRERLIAVHSNRFLLFCVFRKLSVSLDISDAHYEVARKAIRKRSDELLREIILQVGVLFPEGYPGNIFKNTEKQAELLLVLSI